MNGQAGQGQRQRQRQATTATETTQQPVQQPVSRLQEVPVVNEERSQSGITHQVHATTHLHLQQHTGVKQQNIPVTADLIEEDVEIITLTAAPDTANDRHADDSFIVNGIDIIDAVQRRNSLKNYFEDLAVPNKYDHFDDDYLETPCFINQKRRSDGLNLELPIEMAEIKVAKKIIFSPGMDSWSSP